jgi:hypothetical protein
MDASHLSGNAKRVLVGILTDTERIDGAEIPPFLGAGPVERAARGKLLQTKSDLKTLGVPVNLGGWLGHPPTDSESASYSRTMKAMERAKLIRRSNCWGGSSRTTHLRITKKGREALAAVLDAAGAKHDQG